ncbi:transforming growth factor beta regulator 1-like [Branchiostoma floridae]|uniref:Transforming growth factor beta regulator 1-like n=1 Tax=Branchiostoma floridae TaxID=7739 RepID=A0A9J7LPV0_BRAFL|nr:transforming growth factor beta regulator 1-like [Branchiostoma floridae]
MLRAMTSPNMASRQSREMSSQRSSLLRRGIPPPLSLQAHQGDTEGLQNPATGMDSPSLGSSAMLHDQRRSAMLSDAAREFSSGDPEGHALSPIDLASHSLPQFSPTMEHSMDMGQTSLFPSLDSVTRFVGLEQMEGQGATEESEKMAPSWSEPENPQPPAPEKLQEVKPTVKSSPRHPTKKKQTERARTPAKEVVKVKTEPVNDPYAFEDEPTTVESFSPKVAVAPPPASLPPAIPYPFSAMLQSHDTQHFQQPMPSASVAPKKKKKSSGTKHTQQYDNEKYKRKYQLLKRTVKNMVFENAALCDEVSQMDERIAKAKEERKALLKRLFQHQALTEVAQISMVSPQHPLPGHSSVPSLGKPALLDTATPSTAKVPSSSSSGKGKGKDTGKGAKGKEKDSTKPAASSSAKKKKDSAKRVVRPIPLDPTGRPIFPVTLGELTVYSLGDVVVDRADFHNEKFIWPVGFCSTRVFASTRNPHQRCLYTCKISDGGGGPKFEISPEDDPELTIVGSSADECHRQLLNALTDILGKDPFSKDDICGSDFFGFSNPTIQNLIQSCPGARKCTKYKWVKFDACRSSKTDTDGEEEDLTLSFTALQKAWGLRGDEQSPARGHGTMDPNTSLRSLLTSNVPLVTMGIAGGMPSISGHDGM